MDRGVVHGADINWCVRAAHGVRWRSDRSLAQFVVSLYEWNGGGSLPFIVMKATQCFIQVDFVMNPIGSYNVDVVHSRSAEVTAAYASVLRHGTTIQLRIDLPLHTRACRSLMLSAATALVIPSIERIGVAWTNIIAAVLALIGQG
jgi:hypothetical protein